ncbi:MAG: FAD-dependent oxidoreductase [Candidatus Aminicenantes bacterium]|nr:FAD-dependent oxidoreductase [Candidatus Aminicenantes bacterium]
MGKEIRPNKVEVAIIGGGIMGVCIAYYSARLGSEIVLLEKDELGAGCSGANAGLIVPGHSLPLATPGIMAKGIRWLLNPESPFYIKPRFEPELFSWLWTFRRACQAEKMFKSMAYLCELNAASKSLFEEMAAEGVNFFFEKKGLLIVCRTKANWKAAIEEAHDKEKLGVTVDILDQESILQKEPTLKPEVIGGLYFPQDAHIDCLEFVEAVAAKAKEKGVKVLTKAEVIGWQKANGRIKKVLTTRGEIEAEQFVLAAGAWSPYLIKDLDLKLLVQPAKGYSLTYRKPINSPSIPMILSETKVAVTPLAEGLRFGGTLELAGLDLKITHRRVEAIKKAIPNYLKAIDPEKLEFLMLWRGLRPCSPDGLPFIGRSQKYNNLIIACGHSMQGVSLGPITGKIVAQILAGEKPLIDLTPMAVDRYN